MQSIQPKDGNKRLRSSYASSIISVSLVLFMLGLLGVLVTDARKISDYLKEKIEINVFLQDDIPAADLELFIKTLYETDFVKSARYISKEEALDSLKKELGESATSMIESNPLPASIDIMIKAAYSNPDSLAKIKTELEKVKLVRDVSYQQTEISQMTKNFRTVAMVILLFSSLLLFIAIVLINNTIRLAMYSKRFLIRSMQLVGATKSFIRWPFLKRGMVHGVYAGLISIFLLSMVIYTIHLQFPDFRDISDYRTYTLLFPAIVIFGIILSGFSTYFAINKYLKMQEGELY